MKRCICSKCHKRWCTVLDNNNVKSICTKIQLNNSSGFCVKCKDNFQSQQNNHNNTSPISIDTSNSSVIISKVSSTASTSHNTYYKMNQRYCDPKHTTETIIETLLPKKSNAIIKIIESTYFSDSNNLVNKFKTMDEAKEYFARTFSYMTLNSQSNSNIFNFNCPISCKQISDSVHKYPIYEKFHIDMKAIESIFDNNWLNDSAVNLVLACLNFMSIYTSTKSVVPEFLYGSSLDGNLIRPDGKLFPNIKAYLESKEEDENEEMISKCQHDMKLWYCNEKKNKLSAILDAYSAKGKKISNYITCINISNKHWIMLKVSLINKENTPSVVSIDSLNGQDNQALIYRLWFSKFFGLYLKENTVAGIQEIDYSLASMKLARNSFVANVHDGKDSMIEQYQLLSNVTQTDECHCGIFSLIRCLECYRNGALLHESTSQESLLDICLDHRLRLLSLIARIHYRLNKAYYRKLKDHLYMSCGNYTKLDDVYKFQLIHYLFNKGHYKLQLVADEEQDICNANTVYETTTLSSINQLVGKLSTKKKVKRQIARKLELDEVSKTAKKPKLPTHNTYENNISTKSKPKKTFQDQLPTYSLPTYILQQLSNKRSTTAIDFSMHNLVLKVFEGNEKGYGQLSEKARMKLGFHPSHTTTQIKQLFFDSYNMHKETTECQINWNVMIHSSMLQFPTYCLYVVNEQKEYELVGALIVEPYFYLRHNLSSIIHLFAMKDGQNIENYMKVLLYDLFNKDDMKQNNVFIVTSIGQHWFKSTEFLKSMEFEIDGISEGGLSGSIVNQAHTMVVSVSKLLHATKQHKNYMFNNNQAINGFITNFDKSFYRANKHGSLQFYTSTFRWTNATIDEEKLISRQNRVLATNNMYQIFKSSHNYGHRQGNLKYSKAESSKSDTVLLNPIPEMFLQKTHNRENGCSWLTLAILVHLVNPTVAENMITMYRNDYERFEWLGLTKIHRDFKDMGYETVQSILQNERIGYQLKKKKISKCSRQCHIEYLLDNETKGLYLCSLDPCMGSTTHVIGIDCDNKLILDSEETHKLELTMANLNRCCGFNSGGIKSIRLCFMIVPVRTKKGK